MGRVTSRATRAVAEAWLDYAESDHRRGDDSDRQTLRAHGDERKAGEAFREQRRFEEEREGLQRELEREEKWQREECDLSLREEGRRRGYERVVGREGAYRSGNEHYDDESRRCW